MEIADINSLPPSTQEAIKFCVDAHIINLQNTNEFLPEDSVTYEEAICMLSKINGILNRYEHFTL